jgi:hypothetical protein
MLKLTVDFLQAAGVGRNEFVDFGFAHPAAVAGHGGYLLRQAGQIARGQRDLGLGDLAARRCRAGARRARRSRQRAPRPPDRARRQLLVGELEAAEQTLAAVDVAAADAPPSLAARAELTRAELALRRLRVADAAAAPTPPAWSARSASMRSRPCSRPATSSSMPVGARFAVRLAVSRSPDA